jgi:hypothetical protein
MKLYQKDKIKISYNRKTIEAGTIDVMRGCIGCELRNLPCYAAKMARTAGIIFFSPVRREFRREFLCRQLEKYDSDWIRIGCISDPSLDWKTALEICSIIKGFNIKPVVITKVFNPLSLEQRNQLLSKELGLIHISLSGVMSEIQKKRRLSHLMDLKDISVARIVSGAFRENTKAFKVQKELIEFAMKEDIPILDTPMRMFTTSPLWKLMKHDKYHRHRSPISGKKDSQLTAGLSIKNAYPCYSTCSPVPTEHDPIGCQNQCLTRKVS